MTKWIIKLEGGLGNQLFQYAHAKALQIKFGGEIFIDTHAFTKKQIRHLSVNHVCNESIKLIKEIGLWDLCNLRILQLIHKFYKRKMLLYPKQFDQGRYESLCKHGLYIQYKDTAYDSFVRPKRSINYVSGNYLSATFFKGIENIIRQDFDVKEKLSIKSQELLEKIESCNSVCLHVRLGDYLAPEWKDKLYICTPEYYREAVELMKLKIKDPVFFIFSNRHKDFEWIKKNISLDANIVYVNLSNSDYEDLKLMYSCKHFIMSNSTYSWWAQWLGEDKHKVVIAPSRFNNYPRWDMSGIYMDSWLKIELS